MANLIGGSTVGGKEILSVDAMKEMIYEIKDSLSGNIMEKYEKTEIGEYSLLDQSINTPKMNGIWQTNITDAKLPQYANGPCAMTNFSNTSNGLQMLSTIEVDEDIQKVPALAVRTKLNNDVSDWKRIITEDVHVRSLDKKFDKIGGTINGDVSVTGVSTFTGAATFKKSIITNGYLNINNSKMNFSIESDTDGSPIFKTLGSVSAHKFDNDIKVCYTSGTTTSYKKVWHEGTLQKSEFLKSSVSTYYGSYDVKNLTTTGVYFVTTPTSVPSTMANSICVEVYNLGNGSVMQKIYKTDGNAAYMRFINAGTASPWKSLYGVLTDTILVDNSRWVEQDGLYYFDFVHNFETKNVASVAVRDIAESQSLLSSFKVIDQNTVRVTCCSNELSYCTITMAV